jgi:hypothetical protein
MTNNLNNIFLVSANLNAIHEQSQEDSLPPANQMMEFEPEVTITNGNGNGHHFIDNIQVNLTI